jgi:hypothetical protein
MDADTTDLDEPLELLPLRTATDRRSRLQVRPVRRV